MISIQIMNIFDASICKALKLIFRSCLEIAKFPTESEKADVVPAHKKEDKQNLKNYRPISFLLLLEKYLKENCIITSVNFSQKITKCIQVLIYVNDFSDDLSTNVRVYGGDTSLFFADNMNTSTNNLNNDLKKIRNWTIQ